MCLSNGFWITQSVSLADLFTAYCLLSDRMSGIQRSNNFRGNFYVSAYVDLCTFICLLLVSDYYVQQLRKFTITFAGVTYM